MPIHQGDRSKRQVTVSSPLGTQTIQGAGHAYAQKLEQSGDISVIFTGEGGASCSDFQAALLFATTTKSPLLIFVRNNAQAISTPNTDQQDGDGVSARAISLNIPTLRFDGCCALTTMVATKMCREMITGNNTKSTYQGPVLCEAMNYRVGNHSTSDSPTQRASNEGL